MVEEKYILMSMDDSRTKKISEVMSNKTSKQILELIAEKEYTESELAGKLNLALNTVEYNVKKLVEASLIEKSSHFWSIKGKKMPSYKISNKYIIISPKPISKLRSFIPVVLVCGLAGVVIRYFGQTPNNVYSQSYDSVMAVAPKIVETSNLNLNWVWFLGGCLFSLVIYLIYNYKQMKGGSK